MTEYRCSSFVIVEQVKDLLEDGRFPYKVKIKRVSAESGRSYYSL